MKTLDDEQLDQYLREYLRGELDGQLGRAERAFQRRRVLRRIGLAVGVGLAAGLALWVGISLGHGRAPAPPLARDVSPQSPSPAQPPDSTVEQFVYWRTIDAGPRVLGDGTPARELRRQLLERRRYVDPARGVEYEITVPRQQRVLVALQSY